MMTDYCKIQKLAEPIFFLFLKKKSFLPKNGQNGKKSAFSIFFFKLSVHFSGFGLRWKFILLAL